MSLRERLAKAAQEPRRPLEDPWPSRHRYRFVDENGERRFRIPPCVHRGEILKRRERPCCHGLVRVDELFACSHPLIDGGEAWSVMCHSCGLEKE